MTRTMRRRFIIVTLLTILVIIGVGVYHYMKQQRALMPLSHVYVADNPTYNSDFDNWIREDLGIDWVPTYIIIKDNNVIGTIRGGISEKEFTNQLGTILIQQIPFKPLCDFEIGNLNNERHSLTDIMTGDSYYILELSWIDCEDCMYQDANFTDEIYLRYGTKMIYRYYIHSDFDKVLDKYN